MFNEQFATYAVLSFLATGLSFFLAYISWQRRTAPGGRTLSLLMLAAAIWTFTAAFEALAVSPQVKIFWSKIQYLGTQSAPLLFLAFALQYSQMDHWLKRRNITLLAVIPVLTIVLVATNEWHGLIWSNLRASANTQIIPLTYQHGVWFWFAAIFSHTYILIGMLLLIRAALRYYQKHYRQIGVILLGAFVPWASNAVYLLKSPVYDPTPLALVVSGLALTYGIYRYGLLEIHPIARNKLLDIISEAVIVLDAQARVIDLNPAAQFIMKLDTSQVLGKSAAEILKSWPYLQHYFSVLIPESTDISTIQDIHDHWFDTRISPLTNRQQELTGWLIVMHDVTRSKQTEKKLSKQASDLQTVTEVSVAIATSLDTQELLQQVVDLVSKRFKLYHAHIYLFNERDEMLVLTAGSGDIGSQMLAQKRSISLHQEQSIVARAARTRVGVITNDVSADPGFLPHPLLPETCSEMAVPVIVGDQLLGILDVQANTVNRFTLQDQTILTTMAAQIGVALQNARAFAQINEQQTRLSEAMQIAKMGSYEIDLVTQTAVVNSEFLHLLGVPSPEKAEIYLPLATLFEKYLRPHFVQDIEADLQKFFAIPEISSIQREYQYKKGTQICYFLARARIERNETGEAIKFVGTIQDITDQVLLEKSEREQRQLAETLHGIGKALTATLDFDQQLDIMLKQIENVIPYDTANIMLVEGKAAHIIRARGYEKYGDHIQEYLRNISFDIDQTENLAWMYYNCQPYVIPDTHEYTGWMNEKTSYPIKSWIGTPIIAQNRVIAFFSLNATETNFYTAQHAQILAMFASEAALGLENARLFEAERQQWRRAEQRASELHQREYFLSALNEITSAASEALRLPELLQTLADHLGRLMNADACYISLWDETEQTALPGAAYGPLSETYHTIRVLPGETTFTASVLSAGEPLIANDITNSPYMSQRLALLYNAQSMLGIPLIADERKIGAALVAYEKHHEFTTNEISICKQASGQLALAIAKARLFETEQHRAEQLTLINQISLDLASDLELDPLLRSLYAHLKKIVPVDMFYIALHDPTARQFYLPAYAQDDIYISHDQSESFTYSVLPMPDLTGHIIQDRKTLYISDMEDKHVGMSATLPRLGDQTIRCYLGVPLLLHGEVTGVLSIQSYHPDAYSPDLIRLIETIATQLSIALENVRLYQQALATVERSEALRRAIQEISTSSLEAQEVYAAIHRATGLLMPAAAFVISLYDEKMQAIYQAYLYDHGELWPDEWESMENCFAGYVLRKGRSFLINDFNDFPASEYAFNFYGAGNDDTLSGLAVPVFLAEKVVGVLFTQSYHKNAFTEDHRKLLEMIASQAAVALDNARLYSEVQRLAITDSLTGLYNRRHFFKLAYVEFERAVRYQHPLSAIMLDIDHFKNTNDTYGHLVGDVVLQAIANFCQQALRKIDVLARYGGEEFVILMPETNLKDAVQTAERLRNYIMQNSIQTDQHLLNVTISAGVSVLEITATKRKQEPAKLLERLIDQADQALYTAKQTGRNRVVPYQMVPK